MHYSFIRRVFSNRLQPGTAADSLPLMASLFTKPGLVGPPSAAQRPPLAPAGWPSRLLSTLHRGRQPHTVVAAAPRPLSSMGVSQGGLRPSWPTTPSTATPRHSSSGSTSSSCAGPRKTDRRGRALHAVERWQLSSKDTNPGYTLEEVIHHMRPHFDLGHVKEVEVTGKGKHLGVPVNWSMQYSVQGAFFEQVSSEHLNYRWSYDGQPGSLCVEVDGSGSARQLDLDDHEMLVLSMLLRTGLWMRDDVAQRLGVERWVVALTNGIPEPVEVLPIFSSQTVYPSEFGPPPVYLAAMGSAASAAQPSSSPSSSSSTTCVDGLQRTRRTSTSNSSSSGADSESASTASTSSSGASPGDGSSSSSSGTSSSSSANRSGGSRPHVGVCLRLKRGRMIVRLRVDTRTWLPLSYSQSLCGSGELWSYRGWATAAQRDKGAHPGPSGLPRGFHWPTQFSHNVPDGGDYCYEAARVQAARHPGGSRYLGPQWCEALSDTLRVLPGEGRIPFECSSSAARATPAAATVASAAAAAVLGGGGGGPCEGGGQLEAGVVRRVVPAYRTPMGHTLMQVSVNGHEPGWMLLDSGASGFVVSVCAPTAAKAKAVDGEGAQVAGISGKATTSFRWADSIEVGGWRLMRQPLMCMDISHIVRDFHQPLMGIVGYELFRRLVVVLPARSERTTQAQAALSLLNGSDHLPATPTPPQQQQQPATSADSDLTSLLQPQPPPPPASAAGQQGTKRRRTTTSRGSTASKRSTTSSRRPSSPQLQQQQALLEDAARVSATGSGHEAAGDAARSHPSGPSVAAAAAAVPPSTPTAAAAAGHAKQQMQLAQGLQQAHRLVLPISTAEAAAAVHISTASAAAALPLSTAEATAPLTISTASAATWCDPAAGCVVAGGGGSSSSGKGRGVSAQAGPASSPLLVELNHPRYVPRDPGVRWVPMHLVSGLPHIPVTLTTPKGKVATCLLMVDTGAAGTELMLHSRAARELELSRSPKGKQVRSITGVGAGNNSTLEVTIPWVQLGCLPTAPDGQPSDANWQAAQAGQQGAVRFKDVQLLYSLNGGLDISLYSAGIVCAGFLERMRVVFDYPRQRFGFVPQQGSSKVEMLGC